MILNELALDLVMIYTAVSVSLWGLFLAPFCYWVFKQLNNIRNRLYTINTHTSVAESLTAQNKTEELKLMTSTQASEYLKLSRSTVLYLAAAEKIPSICGKKHARGYERFFKKEDLETFMSKRKDNKMS